MIGQQPISLAYLLLAGGQSRRMGGGDKNLMMLGGMSVLARVLENITAQINDDSAPILLNANGDPSRYAAFGLPVAADVVDGHAGPLAGVLTGLEWLRDNHPHCAYMMSLATDAPFLPKDLVARLGAAIEDAADFPPDIVQAASKGRRHPVFAIWPVSLAPALRIALVDDGVRKIDDFTAGYNCAVVEFEGEPDPFMNLNRPDDFAAAEESLQARAASQQ